MMTNLRVDIGRVRRGRKRWLRVSAAVLVVMLIPTTGTGFDAEVVPAAAQTSELTCWDGVGASFSFTQSVSPAVQMHEFGIAPGPVGETVTIDGVFDVSGGLFIDPNGNTHVQLLNAGGGTVANAIVNKQNPSATITWPASVTGVRFESLLVAVVGDITISFTSDGEEPPGQCEEEEDEGLTPEEDSVPNPASPEDPPCGGDPCNTLFGNFFETTADLSVPGRGVPLLFARTYNTVASAESGPLGYGWRHNYQMSLVVDGADVTVLQENGAAVNFVEGPAGVFTPSTRMLATLVRNGNGTYTFTRRNREFFDFSAAGRLTTMRDLNGYATVVAYDGQNRVFTATDAAGRALTFGYDASSRVTSVTDVAGRAASYGYDGSGNLVSVTDVGGGVTTYTYDGQHRVTTILDPRQQSLPLAQRRPVTNFYDAQGRVEWQEDRLGHRTTFTYTDTANGSETRITDPRGHVRLDSYDSRGLRTSVANGFGTALQTVTSFEYDPGLFAVTRIVDPKNHDVEMTYDSRANVLTSTDALDRVWTFTYNAFNQPLSVRDPELVTTTFVYDGAGNLRSESRPLVEQSQTATTTYTYGTPAFPGDVTSVTDPTNVVTSFTYNAHGYRTSAQDPAGRSTWGYDSVGRPTFFVPPSGNVGPSDWWFYARTFTTNAFGDVTAELHPILQRTTSMVYDANRNVVGVTDPTQQTTTFEYDKQDRPTATVRPGGTRLESFYDSTGNLVRQRDGAGRDTDYAYDILGRLTSKRPPVVAGQTPNTTAYVYDSAGNVTYVVDAAWRVTTLAYDNADQLTGVDFSLPTTPDVTIGYDSLGRRTSMTDGSGSWTYDFDSLGRLISSARNATAVAYAYDLAGRRTSLTYPGNRTVTYQFDSARRTIGLTDSAGRQTTFGWDPNDNLRATVTPNGVTETATMNVADEVTAIAHTKAASTLASWTYTRNGEGYTASANPGTISAGNETYGYSATDRLRTVNGGQLYANDNADNLVQRVLTFQTYNTANQVTNAVTYGGGSATYTYDVFGNRTTTTRSTGSARTHGYDQAQRLTSVSGNASATYTYNGDGLRTSKTVGATTTNFTWDLSSPLPMLLTDGTVDYLYGPDGAPVVHVNRSTNVATYFGQDAQQNTRILTDTSGAVAGTYNYDAYGATLAHTGTSTPLQYTGQYTDAETGYQYLRARYYDPATANFLTRDPVEHLTREPYAYAGGNPLNFSDPSGQCPWCVAIGVGIAVGVAIDLGFQVYDNVSQGCSPFDNIDWKSVAISGAIGGATGAAGHGFKAWRLAKAAKFGDDLLPGLPAGAPKIAGLGTSGRTAPRDLVEQLAMTEVRSAPAGTQIVRVTMRDPRWSAARGWVKMTQTVNGVEIHYVRNTVTGAIDDFKFAVG